jgi:hypothetical protein
MESTGDTQEVLLTCVLEGNRYRVRIRHPRYSPDFNCQFPTALRGDNKKFLVPEHAISFGYGTAGTMFYKINKKYIKELNNMGATLCIPQEGPKKIYEVSDEPECTICMTDNKEIVLIPCGHYLMCNTCYTELKKRMCPICRREVSSGVNKSTIKIE